MRDEIADVPARGYKWRVVWQALSDTERIEVGYDTFRMHCRAMGIEARQARTAAIATPKLCFRTSRGRGWRAEEE